MSHDKEPILERLRQDRRFAILLHVRPDGDSIGSSLALGLGLRQKGKDVALVRADELPLNLAFLPGIDTFTFWQDVTGEFDAAILLDCGDRDRVGPARAVLEQSKLVINIDHHLSNGRFGDLNYIEPQAAATGEVVFQILQDLGIGVDYGMAMALYASIVTDTGSFKYESTSPLTHRIAAALLEQGVRPAEVSRSIWEDRPPSSLKLLQAALETLEVSSDGQAAWLSLARADFERTGSHILESEGLVNYPRTIRGVEVAAMFLEETPPAGEDPGEVKVSLRSNRWVDVSRVAAQFGGGGHARAAGCTVRGSLQEVRDRVIARALEALRTAAPAREAQARHGMEAPKGAAGWTAS